MRGFILVIAALALAVWTLLAWAAHGLIGFAGDFAAGGGGILVPFVPPEVLYWTAQLLGGAGGIIVWVVWAIGAAVIALLTLLPLALFRRRRAPAYRSPERSPYGDDAAWPEASRGPTGRHAAEPRYLEHEPRR